MSGHGNCTSRPPSSAPNRASNPPRWTPKPVWGSVRARRLPGTAARRGGWVGARLPAGQRDVVDRIANALPAVLGEAAFSEQFRRGAGAGLDELVDGKR